MAKIKICGIRRQEDVEYLNDFLPDYAGFVLSNGYKRSINLEKAKQLKTLLNPKITTVGVFVNEDINIVNNYLKYGIISIAQLHGDESPYYCNQVQGKIIKYFNCKNSVPNGIDKYNVDYYLFDSGAGSGTTFNWENIPKNITKPFFLAGGINENNITTAIEKINPYCIDLSSSVESNEYKDRQKIKTIMECMK